MKTFARNRCVRLLWSNELACFIIWSPAATTEHPQLHLHLWIFLRSCVFACHGIAREKLNLYPCSLRISFLALTFSFHLTEDFLNRSCSNPNNSLRSWAESANVAGLCVQNKFIKKLKYWSMDTDVKGANLTATNKKVVFFAFGLVLTSLFMLTVLYCTKSNIWWRSDFRSDKPRHMYLLSTFRDWWLKVHKIKKGKHNKKNKMSYRKSN